MSSYNDLQDEELVALCQQSMARTKEILGVLYERHHVGLYNFLRRFVGNAHLAEDLLQETFLRVFRGLSAFRPERRLADWLYTIALNAARDAMRRKRPALLATDVPSGASPAAAAERHEEEELLSKMILQLPDEERAVFLLARVERRTMQETADAMGFSLRTAKNRLASALGRLSHAMGV